MAEPKAELHEIEKDIVGFSGRDRYTCYTCDITLICQPYMTSRVWQQKLDEFLKSHSPNRITRS